MFDQDDSAEQNVQLIFPRKAAPYFSHKPLSIKHFQKTRYIASGAFGKVQQYFSPDKKQFYAIKIMKFNGREDVKNIREIKRELEILYKINSPYLVKLYDHFEEDDKLVYLVMEYVEGNNLYDCLFKPKIELQMHPICKIIYEMCEGLEELHSLKIVHRDIKLENVLLTDAAIKIIDLGQSNHYGEGVERLSKRGTKPYFCPEILNREQQDDRVDSWCLGVVLYELICMSSPFTASTQLQMQQKIRRLNYPILQKMKYEKQLLDLLKKIFTYKSDRLRVSQIKNHPFIKKYLNQDNQQVIRFQNYFSEQQIIQYRQYLTAQIQKSKDEYKQLMEDNKVLEEMIEKTQKKIYGLKNLDVL